MRNVHGSIANGRCSDDSYLKGLLLDKGGNTTPAFVNDLLNESYIQ